MFLDKQQHQLLFVISYWCWFIGSISISSAFFHHPTMVSFHGHARVTTRAARRTIGGGIHHTVSERPPDPKTLLDAATLEERVQTVRVIRLETVLNSFILKVVY
jgi:hypothetical protein